MNGLIFNSEGRRIILNIPKNTTVLQTEMSNAFVNMIENAPWLTRTVKRTINSFKQILDPFEDWEMTGDQMAIRATKMCDLFIQNLDTTAFQDTSLMREVCYAVAQVFVKFAGNKPDGNKKALSENGHSDVLCQYLEKKLNSQLIKEQKQAPVCQPKPINLAQQEFSEEFYQMLDD